MPDHHPRRHDDADLIAELPLLADLIVERLDTRTRERTRWVAADSVAEHLDVDVSYVYEHAAELGARRLGTGPKARLRFRLDLVDEALQPKVEGRDDRQATAVTPVSRRRRRAQSRTHVPLLPIRKTGSSA